MLFNSFEFIAFFTVFIAVFLIVPLRLRWIWLLIASYFFYGYWKIEFTLLLVFSTLLDYFCARKIAAENSPKRKRFFLYLSLGSNLGILFFFKYALFFTGVVNDTAALIDIDEVFPAFKIILPMGISFYTFQTMSYSIDVYKERIQPEKNLFRFATYVVFFPQLVAGPIERAGHLLPELRKSARITSENVVLGSQRLLLGFFKKVVIADRLALFVDPVFDAPGNFEGPIIFIAILFFAFQIYCDFSGYSDIAIGLAQILGINIMENFKAPYGATSINEFWKKWHISLSQWFRDYVYIPLGGNRVVKYRWYYNILITFILSGFWHGANWTFILWGLFHGALLLAEGIFGIKPLSSTQPFLKLLPRRLIIFGLVCCGWILFRANKVSDLQIIFTNLATPKFGQLSDLLYVCKQSVLSSKSYFINFNFGEINLGITGIDFLLVIPFIGMLLLFEIKTNLVKHLISKNTWYFAAISFLLLSIFLFGFRGQNEFIYFQF